MRSDLDILLDTVSYMKSIKFSIVFTNGCFDMFHVGHLDLLNRCKQPKSYLIVGINSDESIKRIKGNNRPIIPEDQRLSIVRNIKCVDFAILFSEETPIKIIERIVPDVLIKGGDWNEDDIIGSSIVKNNNGIVSTIEHTYDVSTSKIIDRILKSSI